MKTTKPYTTNARNQVTKAGQVSVGWDANGNMVYKSNGYTFRYDFQNRLGKTTNPTVADVSGQSLTLDLCPLTFAYVEMPVAFYTKPDQRQERTASAYRQKRFFQRRLYADEPELSIVAPELRKPLFNKHDDKIINLLFYEPINGGFMNLLMRLF